MNHRLQCWLLFGVAAPAAAGLRRLGRALQHRRATPQRPTASAAPADL